MVEELIAKLRDLASRVGALERLETKPRWQDWTPHLYQNWVEVAATVDHASYIKLGSWVFAQCQLTATAAGGTAGIIAISLPVAMVYASNLLPVGTIAYNDTGTAAYVGAATGVSGTQVGGQIMRTGGAVNWLGSDPNFTIASGDIIGLQACYRGA